MFAKAMEWMLVLNNRCQAWGELVFRVIFGCFIFTYGFDKVSSFSERLNSFPDPLGIGSGLSLSLAIFAEFFCSILLILGLFTRFAALNLLITMLVAGLIVLFPDPFSRKELPLLYAAAFFYFLMAGGNRYSIDQKIRKVVR
ncbi:hypothetical protein NKDENANG_02944 [Candidatus Entotheonellaceae bacterium PAL068K]